MATDDRRYMVETHEGDHDPLESCEMSYGEILAWLGSFGGPRDFASVRALPVGGECWVDGGDDLEHLIVRVA